MKKHLRSAILVFTAAATLTGIVRAQTLTDLGTTAPTPGPNDIYQLSTQGNQTWPDGLNYFTDNNPPAGQTFTTGTNVMKLVSVAIKTAGLNSGGGYGTPATTPTYYLSIYSMSGSTATLLITVSAPNPGFTDGDWLKWSGINVPLGTNKTYAFSFGIPGGSGYAALAVATNAYAGGEIALIPISGGTITAGTSHKFDAVFDLGLQPAATNIPASMPWPVPTYGWNLGNTLEATWGVPNFTAAPFYTAANAGFNAVRIPCAWDFNATTNISGGVTNYPINPAFMAKVKQTVDYAIAAGMYVVINDHWDDGWLENNIGTTVDPTINAKMNSYWTQIATAFAGYDNHLLFAAANEPNVSNTAEEVTLMYYYQTFVNAVRAIGGNNTNRWLVIQSVSDPTWLNALPTDTVSNRIMVEYHNYTPSLFTIIHTDQSWGTAIYFWGPAYHYSGDASRNATWGEEYAQDSFYQQLADLYVSKGIPVMIGEFGAYTSSLTGTEATWNTDSVYYWNKYVAESARDHGLSPFFWSTPNSPFDWNTGAVTDAQLISVLTGGAAPPPPNGAPYAASSLTATGGTSQIILSWTAGSGATSYNLYRSTASGFESSNAAPVITGITGTSYTNTGLNSGITYYYQVVATNSSGASGFSAEAHATTSGTTDSAQFNFESSSQGWTGGGGIVSGVATSTAQHYAGNQSLAVNFNGSAAGTGSPSVGNVAVVPGTTITFNVWIPSGSKVTTLQPYLQDHNWAWASGWYPSLTANAWNTLTLTVPANAVSPLQSLGVQFITSAAWTGTCYIDSVSLPTASPDFTLSANPTSLTVNGGTNGTSTITVTPINGLNGVYTMSASNLPSGVTATFATNPITGGASALTLTASNTVTSGTSNVTIIATCGLLSHTTTIALTLLSPVAGVATTVGLTASANPSIYGNPVTFTATVQTNNVAVGTISGETITFYNGTVQLGTGTLNGSGQATYAISATQLPAVTNPITAVYGGDSTYSASTNSPALSQIVNRASLTAGLTGTVIKNYNGTTTATLAAGNYTLSGVVGSDTVTLNNPTSGTYDTKNQGSGKTVNVTGLVISGASATNYTLSSASTSGAVGVINKTNITVTAAANTKPYDGTINAAALPTVTSGGVQTGDAANFAETYDTRNVGGGKTLTPSGAVTDGNSGNNYNYSFVASANGTINAVTLTYTANTASMTYGSAVPGLSGSVGGFVTGENQANATSGTMTFTTTATSSSSVGSYAINGSGLTASNGNYGFVQAAGNATALTINPLAANLTGSRPYDRTTAAAAGILSVTNKVGSDNVTVASGSGALAGANIGLQAITSFGTLALGGTAAGNYTLSGASGSVNITAAGLAVTNLLALDKVYDGTTNATLDATNAGLAGVWNGDSVTLVTSDAVGYFASPNVGTNKPVTVSGLTLVGDAATNYTMMSPTNVTANILSVPVTIVSGITANNKPYDGTTVATISSNNVVLNGVISGDAGGISLSTNTYTAAFATTDVGTGIAVTVGNLSLTGSAAANYTLNPLTGLTADILQPLIPVLTEISAGSGGWQLSFRGPAGHNYQVLATDDLMLPLNQWTMLAGGTFGSDAVTFTDSSTNLPLRFYRIVSP